MTQDAPHPEDGTAADLDALEAKLETDDAADAPDTAEEIARRLGDTLDRIEGGSGSGSS